MAMQEGAHNDTGGTPVCGGGRTGSAFRPAAERVFVTQPALSLAIKKLEDDLGVTIFERRQNKIELTPLGEQIVHQAQRALEEAERIKLLTAQGKDPLNGLCGSV